MQPAVSLHRLQLVRSSTAAVGCSEACVVTCALRQRLQQHYELSRNDVLDSVVYNRVKPSTRHTLACDTTATKVFRKTSSSAAAGMCSGYGAIITDTGCCG
eukprot:7836-Heterococcus_DN1.PRE.7